MTWEYGLIGLVVGIIVGAVAMRFGNKSCVSSAACSTSWKNRKRSWRIIAKS